MPQKGIQKLKPKLVETHPEIAKMLYNQELGLVYSKGSTVKLDWVCPRCNSIVKDKFIYNVIRQGLSCKMCGDRISINEKIMVNVLKCLELDFETEKTFTWSKNKRYDFYIESLNIIIEMHGLQHYEESFSTKGARTLKEEKENDKLKYDLAIKNGIGEYIVIDCRKSELEFIKTSILNSDLTRFFNFDNVNWEECFVMASKSNIIEASKLFNNGYKVTEIAKILKVARTTVAVYLKRCAELNLCTYIPEKEREKGRANSHEKAKRKIVQLTLDGEYVKSWNAICEAKEFYKFKTATGIVSCCKGDRRKSYGFKWMYLEDYEKSLIK